MRRGRGAGEPAVTCDALVAPVFACRTGASAEPTWVLWLPSPQPCGHYHDDGTIGVASASGAAACRHALAAALAPTAAYCMRAPSRRLKECP